MEQNRQQIERRFWDGYAKHYDPLLKGLNRYYSRIFDVVRAHVDPTKRVLEVATGTGTIALGIADRSLTVEACDISPAMIRIAQRKLAKQGSQNVVFCVQDAYELGYPDSAFDVIIASNALHVMISPDRALTSIKRVMKSSAILVAPTFCHGQNLLSHAISRIMSLRGFRAHHRWSISGLQAFFESNAFDVIDHQVVKGSIPLLLPVLRLASERNGA